MKNEEEYAFDKIGKAGREVKPTIAPAWFVRAPDEVECYPICWVDVCSYMDKADRPAGYNEADVSKEEEEGGGQA